MKDLIDYMLNIERMIDELDDDICLDGHFYCLLGILGHSPPLWAFGLCNIILRSVYGNDLLFLFEEIISWFIGK